MRTVQPQAACAGRFRSLIHGDSRMDDELDKAGAPDDDDELDDLTCFDDPFGEQEPMERADTVAIGSPREAGW